MGDNKDPGYTQRIENPFYGDIDGVSYMISSPAVDRDFDPEDIATNILLCHEDFLEQYKNVDAVRESMSLGYLEPVVVTHYDEVPHLDGGALFPQGLESSLWRDSDGSYVMVSQYGQISVISQIVTGVDHDTLRSVFFHDGMSRQSQIMIYHRANSTLEDVLKNWADALMSKNYQERTKSFERLFNSNIFYKFGMEKSWERKLRENPLLILNLKIFQKYEAQPSVSSRYPELYKHLIYHSSR